MKQDGLFRILSIFTIALLSAPIGVALGAAQDESPINVAWTDQQERGFDYGLAFGYGSAANKISNAPPAIDEASLQIQIKNADGPAWAWKNGTKSGYRAAPYVLNGDKIRMEVDVSDADGEAEMAGMNVKAILGPTLEFQATLQFKVFDPVNGITRGHYSADMPIGAGIAQGKYDLVITATDPHGAAATYNPVIYQATVDILMKPTVTLGITGSSLTFLANDPGKRVFVPSGNPVGLRPQAVIGTDHIPVVFTVSQVGTDMTSSTGGALSASSIAWAFDGQTSEPTALSATQQTIAGSVKEGQTVDVYYWLNLPVARAQGTYRGKISYAIVAR